MQQPTPSFDTWTSGFLIAVAMGVFLFLLLISNGHKKVRPIAFFVLAFTVILFQYVLYWTGFQYELPFFYMLPPLCYYLTGPLLYRYVLQLYGKQQSKNSWLHFIPASICIIAYFTWLLKYVGAYNVSIAWVNYTQYYQTIVVHMLLYAGLSFRFVSKQKKDTSEYTTIRKKWANTLIALYTTFVTAYLSYYILVNFSFFNNTWDYAISIVMTIAIYTIGYFIFKQPKVFDGEIYTTLFLPSNTISASLENQLLNELFQKIETYMIQKKPYINNELRLANLADQLGFSTHLLSKVINQKSGKNFNTFVNNYRLTAAEDLLLKEHETSIKTVYYDVGFNSKAAFYNAFKQKHQCTPMQYRKQFQLS